MSQNKPQIQGAHNDLRARVAQLVGDVEARDKLIEDLRTKLAESEAALAATREAAKRSGKSTVKLDEASRQLAKCVTIMTDRGVADARTGDVVTAASESRDKMQRLLGSAGRAHLVTEEQFSELVDIDAFI
jgi:ribosomal protein L29